MSSSQTKFAVNLRLLSEAEALMPHSEWNKPLKPVWQEYKRRKLGEWLSAGASPEIARKLFNGQARQMQVVASSSLGGDEGMFGLVTALEEMLSAYWDAHMAVRDFYKIEKPTSRDYRNARTAVEHYHQATLAVDAHKLPKLSPD